VEEGGYREWLMQQESVEVARQLAAEAGELLAAGGSLADKLAVWVTARYVVAARNLGNGNPGAIDFATLRALCSDLVALRRGDHSAARLEIERQRLASTCVTQHARSGPPIPREHGNVGSKEPTAALTPAFDASHPRSWASPLLLFDI